MKVIKYTLLENGKIPNEVVNGGYFIKYNGNKSPQDYDMIGISLDWNGIQEFTTKTEFENYIKSFLSDHIHPIRKEPVIIQDLIDEFWNKSII
tara:strand:+ start:1948 stop:2226 length:279 start_codon:yes stop_codon:yes gene_type:complete